MNCCQVLQFLHSHGICFRIYACSSTDINLHCDLNLCGIFFSIDVPKHISIKWSLIERPGVNNLELTISHCMKKKTYRILFAFYSVDANSKLVKSLFTIWNLVKPYSQLIIGVRFSHLQLNAMHSLILNQVDSIRKGSLCFYLKNMHTWSRISSM